MPKVVPLKAFVDGKDAALIENVSRALCHNNGSNCYPKCKTRHQCGMHGWPLLVDEVAVALRTIRETHVIKPKSAKP